MLHDRNALERHDYTATRAERTRNAKHLVLHLNPDGPQKSCRQRQDYADALKRCRKMQDVHLAETEQSLIPICPQHQQRQRQKSAIRRRRKLRLLRRSQNLMTVLQRATVKPVGSVFIFNIAVAKLTMANELEIMATCII